MRTHDLNGFSGINITNDPTRIRQSELAKCENAVITPDSAIKKRTGYEPYLSSYQTSVKIQNIYQYITIDGKRRLVVISEGEVYQYYGGEWSQINEVTIDGIQKLGVTTYYDKLFIVDKEKGVFVYQDTILNSSSLIVGVESTNIHFYDATTFEEITELKIEISIGSYEGIGQTLYDEVGAVDLTAIKIFNSNNLLLLVDDSNNRIIQVDLYFVYQREVNIASTTWSAKKVKVAGNLLLCLSSSTTLYHYYASSLTHVKTVTLSPVISGITEDGVSATIDFGMFSGVAPFPWFKETVITVEEHVVEVDTGDPTVRLKLIGKNDDTEYLNVWATFLDGDTDTKINIAGDALEFLVTITGGTCTSYYFDLKFTTTYNGSTVEISLTIDNTSGLTGDVTKGMISLDSGHAISFNFIDLDTGDLEKTWENSFWFPVAENSLTIQNIVKLNSNKYAMIGNEYIYVVQLPESGDFAVYPKIASLSTTNDVLLHNSDDSKIFYKKDDGGVGIIRSDYDLNLEIIYDDLSIDEFIFKPQAANTFKKMVQLMTPGAVYGWVYQGSFPAVPFESAKYFCTYYFSAAEYESPPSSQTTTLERFAMTGPTYFHTFKIMVLDIPQGIIDAGLTKIKVYRATVDTKYELFAYIGDITDFDDPVFTDEGESEGNLYQSYGNPYLFSMVKVYLNRLVFSGNPLLPSYVVYSPTDEPEIIDLDNYREVNQNDKDINTAIEVLQNQLIVFKTNNTYAFLGDIATGSLVNISKKIGALSQNVVIAFKNVVFHMDRTGFYICNGNTTDNISDDKILNYFDETYEDRIDMSMYKDFRIFLHKSENKIKWLIVDVNGDKKLFCFNYLKKIWTTESYYHDITEIAIVEDDDTLNPKIVFGDDDGQLWNLNKNVYSDGGENISFNIKTKKFDLFQPLVEKWFKKVFINAKTNLEIAGAYKIDEAPWLPFELKQEGTTEFISNLVKIMNGRGKYLQLNFFGSDKKEPFEINGLHFKYNLLKTTGRGK